MPVRGTEPPDLETASEAYARRFAGPVGAWFLEVQAQATRHLLSTLPKGSALDVGGGHGQLIAPVRESGFAVTVLGSQEAAPERLQGLLRTETIRFVTGSIGTLPFEARAFDVVLAYRLLPHVEAWQELISELCRVARRAVLIDYPTLRSVNAGAGFLFPFKRRVETDTRPFRVFSEGEIAEAFRRAGFRTTGRLGEFVLPMAFHRAAGVAPFSRGLEGALSLLGLRRLLGSPVILRAEPT
jgi:2-polyprenyl-3-methyl-5-hydroxy-6-metoxy-1,4-benzoquinol methylase